LPGKHITHQQEAIYMKNRQIGHGQETGPKHGDRSRIENIVDEYILFCNLNS